MNVECVQNEGGQIHCEQQERRDVLEIDAYFMCSTLLPLSSAILDLSARCLNLQFDFLLWLRINQMALHRSLLSLSLSLRRRASYHVRLFDFKLPPDMASWLCTSIKTFNRAPDNLMNLMSSACTPVCVLVHSA